MKAREWEEQEARLHEQEKMRDRESRFGEPTDAEIDAELVQRLYELQVENAKLRRSLELSSEANMKLRTELEALKAEL